MVLYKYHSVHVDSGQPEAYTDVSWWIKDIMHMLITYIRQTYRFLVFDMYQDSPCKESDSDARTDSDPGLLHLHACLIDTTVVFKWLPNQ